MMVDIMNECFKDTLCKPISEADWGVDTALPTPNQLRKKILVKVKYTPPEKAEAEETATDGMVPATRVETSSSSDSDTDKDKSKIKKIVDALSKLGIYTRSYHFSSLLQPEAKVPTHIFSLSESSLIGLHKDDPQGLFNHNKKYMMRAYPKGTRISSSNLDPSLFWRLGVQMVALNWQKIDKGMMLQEAMFDGTAGWAQKPTTYLSNASFQDSVAHVSKGGKSWLHISILAAQNLPMPSDGDAPDKFRPYIKCEMHVEMLDKVVERKRFGKKDESRYKQKIGPSRGPNPQFDEKKENFRFDSLPSLEPSLSFIR